MKFKTIKRILITYLVNHFYVGTKCFEHKRKLLNSIGYELGEGTKVVAPIECTGFLKTGNNCWIGKNLKINGNGRVVLGDRCDIAPDVSFQTGGHDIGTHERRAGKGIIYDISVGNGCWIGARSTVLGGVKIGDGCVIAACACVCNNIPENTLVGGIPAKQIRSLE